MEPPRNRAWQLCCVDGKPFKVDIYITNLALKKLCLRNIIIDGATDEDAA